MTAVWDKTPYEGGDLLVLLALADWADDSGRCFPSVKSIAAKARLTERQVYNVLRKMRADGVIATEPGGGRGNRTTYVINTAKISGFALVENPEIRDQKTLKSATRNPEICNKPPHPLIGRTVKEPLREPPSQNGRDKKAIHLAAAKVCLQGTFVGKPIAQAIADAIGSALSHPDCELNADQLADSMSRRWGEYQEMADAGVLRYLLGPEKFFAGGHWRPDSAWPYDQQKLQIRREAVVGARKR